MRALAEVVERINTMGTEVFYAPSAEFAAFVTADLPKWLAAGKEAGIEPR